MKAIDVPIGQHVIYKKKHGNVIWNTSGQGDEVIVVEFDDDFTVSVLNVNDVVVFNPNDDDETNLPEEVNEVLNAAIEWEQNRARSWRLRTAVSAYKNVRNGKG